MGEAIAFAYGGVPITPDRILLSNFSGLADEFSVLATTLPDGQGANVGESVGRGVEESVDKGVEAELAGVRTHIMDKLLKELVHHSRAEVRQGSGEGVNEVWEVRMTEAGAPQQGGGEGGEGKGGAWV